MSSFAHTRKTSHAGSFASTPYSEGRSRHPVNAYALATCIVLGLSSPLAAQSSTREMSAIHSELVTTPGAESITTETLEAQAYIWMQRGRADKAAKIWRKLLLLQPQHATALSELAVYTATSGTLTEAQQLLSELQDADPRDGRLAFVRAMLRGGDQVAAELREARSLSKAGRPQMAIQHYWKAFGETEPTTLIGIEYYQVLAATPDSWGVTHAGLERLAELYPRAAHVQLALALNLTRVPSTRIRGIQLLRQLAGIPEVSSEAHTSWRQSVMWLGESPQAVPSLQAYVSANPQDNELRHRLELLEPRLTRQNALREAFQALEAGELDQAEEKFQSIPGAERDTAALVGLASVALAHQAFDQAAKLLSQARELAPQRPELWQKLLSTAELWQDIKRAEVLRLEGRLDEAQKLLEHAATTDATERYQAVLALVEIQLERGDLPGAQHNLRDLLNVPPPEAAGMHRMVSLLVRANLDEQAMAANEQLCDIDASAAFRPEDLQAERLRLRAIHLRQAGDVIAARDTLVAAASLNPRASQVWLDLVHLDLELGDLDGAQRSIEVVLKTEPGLPEAVLVEAQLAEQRGQYERSLKLLSTIAASATSDEINNLHCRLEIRLAAARAVRTFHIGGVSAARMQLSELERATQSSTNMAIVAQAWADIGEFDHAVLLLRAGDTASAEVPGMRLQMAAMLLGAGHTSEAMAVLVDLATRPGLTPAEQLALQKLRVVLVVRIADSLRSQGDLAAARSELTPWTKSRPLDPQIANAYGRVLHDAGDYVAAAGQYARVLKRDPGNIDALQGLTHATLNDGFDLTKARQAIRQGLQVHSDDPRLHLSIARLDAKAGNNRVALKELAQANRLVENEMRSDAMLTSMEKTTTEPPSGAQQLSADLEQLRSEIQSETQLVGAAAGAKIKPEITMQSRQGTPGRDALFELTMPSRLEFPNPWGTFSLQVTPIRLSAGQLVLDTTPFGTVGKAVGKDVRKRNIEAEGVALGAGYGYRGLQLDVGVTPVNFALLNIVGGLCWKLAFRNVTLELEASRRAVEESVLSFAGVTDSGTGNVWGGVVKQGGAMTLRYDSHNSRSYVVLDYDYLTGTNVKQNQSLAAYLGLRWDLYHSRTSRFETGIAVSAMTFERNLSRFTYGHGGYFSPQRFVHYGLPIDWQGSYQAMAWQLNLEPGVTWFQTDETPYYPLAAIPPKSKLIAKYPSRESLGLSVDGGLEIGYNLTPQMTLGARAELHTGDDYRELGGVAFLRFALKGGGDLVRGD